VTVDYRSFVILEEIVFEIIKNENRKRAKRNAAATRLSRELTTKEKLGAPILIKENNKLIKAKFIF
jgi:hypothetical protein